MNYADRINGWVKELDKKGLSKVSSELSAISDKISALLSSESFGKDLTYPSTGHQKTMTVAELVDMIKANGYVVDVPTDPRPLEQVVKMINEGTLKMAAEGATQERYLAPSMEYILQNTKPAKGDAAKSEDPVMGSIEKALNVYEGVYSFVKMFKTELAKLLKKYDEEVAIAENEEARKKVEEKFVSEKAKLVRMVDGFIDKKFKEMDIYLKRQ